MATFSAEVTNRANRREHCLVDAGQLESIGCALGQQVRVIKSQDQFALYTVGEVRRERPPTIVRMTAEGRERLGASGEFDAPRRSCFGLPENIGQRELEELIMTKLCLKIFR